MRRSLYTRGGKRALDLVLILLVSPVLVPLFVVLAVAVKLTSRGPVFYGQERAGRDGHPFRLVKFRSMIVGAENVGAGIRVEKNDSRITAAGRWMRRLSLDEIPQLLNVVAGHMSLVGPRPALPYQVEQYDERQRRRLQLRPGLTGWAQVNGRNRIDWAERIRLDLEYLERVSLWMDLRILARSVPTVLLGSGMIASREYWRKKDGGGNDSGA